MATNIEVNGTLYPTADEPTHSDIYGSGGYKAVATVDERDDIASDFITDGCLVFVRSTNITYQWKNNTSEWKTYPLEYSIDSAQLATGSVTSVKLADNSVSSAKIQDSAVVADGIQDGAVTAVKLNSDVADAYYTQEDANATFMPVFVTAPDTASDTGVAGTVAYDSDYFYVCVDTDTWVRTALVTW